MPSSPSEHSESSDVELTSSDESELLEPPSQPQGNTLSPAAKATAGGGAAAAKGGAGGAGAGSAAEEGRWLSREQVRQMVRIQLQILKRDAQHVPVAWIDALFDEFDADCSGLMDDSEWDRLVEVLKDRPTPAEPTARTPTPTPGSPQQQGSVGGRELDDAGATPESDAATLYRILNSGATNRQDGLPEMRTLGTIVLGRTCSELQAIKRLYGRKYHRTLVGQINKQLGGEYRNFLVDRLAPRDEDTAADRALAAQQVEQIAEAARSADTQVLEQALVETLGRASPAQVGAVKAAYRLRAGHAAAAAADGEQTLFTAVKRRLGQTELGWAVMLLLECSPDDAAPSEEARGASEPATTTITVPVSPVSSGDVSPVPSTHVSQARLAAILGAHQDEQRRSRAELVETTARLQAELTSARAELRRSRSNNDDVEQAKLHAHYSKDETIKFLREKVRTQAELAAVYHNQVAVLRHEKADHEDQRARDALRLREEEERTAQLRQELVEEQSARAEMQTELAAEQAANGTLKAHLEQLTEEVCQHEAGATRRQDAIVSLTEEVESVRHQYETQVEETRRANQSNKQLVTEAAALRSELEQQQAALNQQIRNINLLKGTRFGSGSPRSPAHDGQGAVTPAAAAEHGAASNTHMDVVVSKSMDVDVSPPTPGTTKDVSLADFEAEPI